MRKKKKQKKWGMNKMINKYDKSLARLSKKMQIITVRNE